MILIDNNETHVNASDHLDLKYLNFLLLIRKDVFFIDRTENLRSHLSDCYDLYERVCLA